ncbi:glucose-1-phosphate adenylyltransferase [Modestobacter sp. I12A-02628]|uniref:Glucose-1-phosphate adenylyltransferase n=1 Tax=Goekera deserti TaxID=2497753 RepID=A0A7K3WDT9_9ACTN|nr:glucose-1-phosphate adenylyltransferase [Goekera deserti]MPQ98500.1 glucose-1-phosphate adenylyltransferase [Goekera deserti]NDI48330.1 glucose-1-phosphate adenylyltransferase [Goekera deserti]NEL54079.1 glucose-1-phosphate adenylyltransferase [Goekera deserti]
MRGGPRVLGIVLAGGEGKRLSPLTQDRAKPAVPFGGNYRLVDFVLSNLVNADIRRIAVLTQYKSHSLDRHITTTWRMSSLLGSYVTPVPAQQRLGPRWFTGSADAIYQSLNLIYDDRPDIVVVFGADNVYRMDPAQMIEQHVASGAGVTIAALRVPRADATEFGVIDAGEDKKIRAFLEKPADPPGLPDSPDESFVSMGNYCFSTDALLEALRADAEDEDSVHDMGGSIMPMLVSTGDAYVYDFSTNVIPGSTERDHGYWRDVGTIDSYYDAHMDLVSVTPVFNMYNDKWPIYTLPPQFPPAKFVLGGRAEESMVSAGVILGGGSVLGSVLSPGVRMDRSSRVEDSVLMDGVQIGEGAVVRRAILDKNVVVPPWARIGVDEAADRERYHVSAGGITVLGKGARAIV